MPATPHKYRHLIIIERPVPAVNDLNERVDTWQTFARVYAGVRTATAREITRATQTATVAPTTFRMRYLPGVTSAMRIRYAGKVYPIVSAVNVDERDEELEVLCNRA